MTCAVFLAWPARDKSRHTTEAALGWTKGFGVVLRALHPARRRISWGSRTPVDSERIVNPTRSDGLMTGQCRITTTDQCDLWRTVIRL
jgi:hypothetical protein